MGDTPTTPFRSLDEMRRRQLAKFLKSRRARIAPETVGFIRGPRRRVSGLRREEVADLAAVGITWYTWLEQGRDIHVSDEVVAAIARALILDADETEHLFSLARPAPISAEADTLGPARYQSVLDALDPNPAHLRDRRWNLLAWNRAFAAASGFDQAPEEERNLLWLMFTAPSARELIADWEEVAETAVAQFRFECGPYLGDGEVSNLVSELRHTSSAFSEWWNQYDVYSAEGTRTEWDHPEAGRLAFERCVLAQDSPDRGPHQRLLHVLLPVPGSGTDGRVSKLTTAAA